MPAIDVAHVSKRFFLQPDRPRSFQELLVGVFKYKPRSSTKETLWALRDLTFAVGTGETLGIIGSNGSGKSTCLKLLTHILEPTIGRISVQGRVSALLELGAGFHPELTGRENIFLHGSVLGLSRREMASRLDDIVTFAELERFIDVPVKLYSSGMYVRLAFATAINVSPDVLLIDEVLAVGDQNFQEKCLERIHAIKARGVTIVFVSHSLDAIRSMCDRTIWLDKGVMREDGLTDVVIAQYLRYVHEKEEREAIAEQESRHKAQRASTRDNEEVTPGGKEAVGDSQTPDHSEEPDDADPMARYRNRWGSREAEIVDVSFLDREGQAHLLFATGEPMTIVMHYRASKRMERPMFGLAIHRSDGLQINGPNNNFSKFEIPYISGEGEVRYKIDVLPLLEGTYYLTVALYDEGGSHAYDHQALNYVFKVHRGDIRERYGTVYVPATWEHLPYHGGSEKSDSL